MTNGEKRKQYIKDFIKNRFCNMVEFMRNYCNVKYFDTIIVNSERDSIQRNNIYYVSFTVYYYDNLFGCIEYKQDFVDEQNCIHKIEFDESELKKTGFKNFEDFTSRLKREVNKKYTKETYCW